MPRVPRTALPDGYFHVWTRSVALRDAFHDGPDRNRLLALVRRMERRGLIRCHAATVLSTHYHAVLEATVSGLSRALHVINGRYARSFNKRYGLYGHVFAERFQVRVIEDEWDVFDRCEYVLQNPVKAGLCSRAEDWPWSRCIYWTT